MLSLNDPQLGALFAAGEVVFFAGAGISVESGAYSPDQVVAETSKHVFPSTEYAQEIDYVLGSIQPEIFYENITTITRDDSWLAIWSILATDYLTSVEAELTPNPFHICAVEYSYKHGVPIFTTNFDQLFELAAIQNGLVPDKDFVVVLPGSREEKRWLDELEAMSANKGPLRIYKLHGCAGQMQTLRSTMHSITRTNQIAIKILATACRTKNLVLAGYSGRDFDLFPYISSFSNKRQVYWFSIKRKSVGVQEARLVGAHRVLGKPRVWITQRWGLGIDQYTHSFDADAVLRRRADEISRTVRFSESTKRLILATALFHSGESERAIKLYEQHNWNDASFESSACSVYYSRALDRAGRYEQAQMACTRGLRQIAECPDMATHRMRECLKSQLLSQLLYLRKMLKGPLVSFGFPSVDSRWGILDTLDVMGTYVLGGFRLRRLVPIRKEAFIDEAQLKAEQAILNHRMILFGMVLNIVEALWLLGALRAPLSTWLESLARDANDAGDYFTIANVNKYKNRLGLPCGALDPQRLYTMISDPLNEALYWRDAAANNLRHGDRNSAVKALKVSCEKARLAGSLTTELKSIAGLIGLREIDNAKVVSDRLVLIQNQIEGAAYKQYAARLISVLNTTETAPTAD
ncbi:SIR2 family protein [Lentisalinibacter salinarum]|uniref:SIR2 family protein n=1 Tax=Lentisalinibacter salinarum TaxID=2992239 RepID=UPI0038642DED